MSPPPATLVFSPSPIRFRLLCIQKGPRECFWSLVPLLLLSNTGFTLHLHQLYKPGSGLPGVHLQGLSHPLVRHYGRLQWHCCHKQAQTLKLRCYAMHLDPIVCYCWSMSHVTVTRDSHIVTCATLTQWRKGGETATQQGPPALPLQPSRSNSKLDISPISVWNLLQSWAISRNPSCITTGGPSSGRPCVFPFTYNGISFY